MAGIGINQIALTNPVIAVNLHQHLHIRLHPMKNLEINFSPAKLKHLIKIIRPRKKTTQSTVYWPGKLFRNHLKSPYNAQLLLLFLAENDVFIFSVFSGMERGHPARFMQSK
jgi:hypothetical protein